LTLSDPVRFSRVLPRYLERPGRYFLPSGFIPVRITKLLTNPFPLFYLLPNLKLPVLVLIWGLRAKKLESVFPHTTPGYLDRVGTYYLPVSLLYGLPSFSLTCFPCFTITRSQISEFGYYFGV
jgi:hypothetical protein